jgi:hypothetical protein
MSGVVEIPKKPDMSLDSLMSGQYQTDFEQFMEFNLATRRLNTRIYNQLLYSVFGSTENDSIIVGREKYLYETAYPSAYLTEVEEWHIQLLTEKIYELVELNQLLKERGIALVVRISPTKAEHYPEYLPPAYDRFVQMKQNGEYNANWYEVFVSEIKKTSIPFYDRYDLIQEMKQDNEILFAKGGTHWTLAPMEEYVNGFNALLEELLEKELGRLTVVQKENRYGEMGISNDEDIWDICWNALFAEPNYPSPHVIFDTNPGDFAPKILNVGQSFSTIMLHAIYYNIDEPVWKETLFSWYNGHVLLYPNPYGYPWGERIADRTDDYERYLEMDVIVIEFLETTASPYAVQFEFVHNMLNYMKGEAE